MFPQSLPVGSSSNSSKGGRWQCWWYDEGSTPHSQDCEGYQFFYQIHVTHGVEYGVEYSDVTRSQPISSSPSGQSKSPSHATVEGNICPSEQVMREGRVIGTWSQFSSSSPRGQSIIISHLQNQGMLIWESAHWYSPGGIRSPVAGGVHVLCVGGVYVVDQKHSVIQVQ